jgi:hypothetical protein
MFVIQDYKAYSVSSRLHLPHASGELELTTTFCHITYININGVQWKWKNAAYFKFQHIRAGVLLVRYRRKDEVSLSAS